jgi:hypothetical protein
VMAPMMKLFSESTDCRKCVFAQKLRLQSTGTGPETEEIVH